VSETLLWLHPLMQGVAALLGVWAMWQGGVRIAFQLGRKVIFPWRTHVKVGSIALVLWTMGALGFYVTHDIFGATHMTGLHAYAAWPVVACSVFALASGCWMDRRKRKRRWLPLLHGVVNVLLVLLVLIECWTGLVLMPAFL
jgi:hypothetical protein